MRISNSFSEDEIQVLEFVTQTLLRGGDPRVATRNKAFPSLCRKVMAMKAKVKELKQRPTQLESSVGTVGAPAAAGAPESAEAALGQDDMARAV